MKGRFRLDEDNASEIEVRERIEAGVIFRGVNLWVLIFATMVASIGLNMNSTAVIIGAMLISPLMGPIMGMGVSVAIRDFALLKRSVKNFTFMVLVSIATSTLYFYISPMTVTQSELLARTQPTTWDVLIAFFGGLAGIVAQTRKDRTSTVIPGVAIATALMPPLCTAGFGLATGQLNYFAGAFYLFIINAVFIGLASTLIINYLHYHKVQSEDPARDKKVKRMMAFIIFVTIVPSVFIGYELVRKTMFEENTKRFIEASFKFEDSQVVNYKTEYNPRSDEKSVIRVFMIGNPISKDVISAISTQMGNYYLTNTNLEVKQDNEAKDESSSYINTNFEELITEKNQKIKELEERTKKAEEEKLPSSDISRELSAFFDTDYEMAIGKNILHDSNGITTDTVVVCYVGCESNKIPENDKTKIVNWLKVRTNNKNVKLLFD